MYAWTDVCLDIVSWDQMFCNHANNHKGSGITDSALLSRYPWGMMTEPAKAIIKAVDKSPETKLPPFHLTENSR